MKFSFDLPSGFGEENVRRVWTTDDDDGTTTDG